MEKGVHLRKIQYLMGHSSMRASMRYTQITDISKIDFDTPLDDLF